MARTTVIVGSWKRPSLRKSKKRKETASEGERVYGIERTGRCRLRVVAVALPAAAAVLLSAAFQWISDREQERQQTATLAATNVVLMRVVKSEHLKK